MRILLGADFHLGARQNWLGPQAAARRDDLDRAFGRFVDFALRPESSIDAVLLLGDLFDHHAPPAPLVGQAAAQIERLLAGGLPVAAVPGTHDGYGYPDSVYRSGKLPGGLHLIASPELSRTVMDVRGTALHLYGLAYDPGRTPPDPLGRLRREEGVEGGFHVAMIHGSLPASPEWEYRRRDLPVPTSDLASSGLHLVALGHYHNFMEKKFGLTTVVYPGTLEGLKYSESGERAFAVAELGPEGVRIHRTPYPGRQILDETIDLDLLGGAVDRIEERLAGLAGADGIVRVTFTGHAPPGFDPETLARRLAGGFFHLAMEDRTLSLDDRWAERIASESTIRGLFVRRMRERIAGADEAGRPTLELALRLGLAEFSRTEALHAD